jgi:predicted ATPase
MYIDKLKISGFRTFQAAEIDFLHPDLPSSPSAPAPPTYRNINLVVGNNGFGKTSLLKAVALSALGPAVGDSGIHPYRLVRRPPGQADSGGMSVLEAEFRGHPQDHSAHQRIESLIHIERVTDLERLKWAHREDKAWHPIFSADSEAFFMVGYGANRRVEKRTSFDQSARQASSFARAQRIQSLFEESYSLAPLTAWLPRYESSDKRRHTQAVDLINELMGEGHYAFNGEFEGSEYVFEKDGVKVPFPALSDGYRAYLGWIADLLFHVCETCPAGKPLVDNRGIVMIDEIDLHLHPKWQMTVLPTIAQALPKIQFIVTSHSPLVVGSMESANIILMQPGPNQTSVPSRITERVHGLDADQILMTSFFGLETTRAGETAKRLDELTTQAASGSLKAANQLLEELSGRPASTSPQVKKAKKK